MEESVSTTPKWIRELQETSWNLEFLISGGAIFTLVQASGYFAETVQSLKITTALPGTDFFLLLGVLAIQVLTLGFGLHLLLRSFWVALVCVTYLYPDGAAPGRIRWRRPFRAPTPDGSYFYDLLVRLNRVCATVMFLAISSTLLLGGLMLVVAVLGTLPSLFVRDVLQGWYYWYGEIFLLFLVLYILDLLLFSALRRTPGLSWLVFPVFWLFDWVSLRVVLQPALTLFVSHVPRRRLAALFAGFLAVALVCSYGILYHDLRLPNVLDQRSYREQLAPGSLLLQGVYRDEMQGRLLRGASLPSKFIDKPFMEVFLVYRKEYDEDIAGTDSVRYLSDLVRISIDDSLYRHLDWYPTRNQANDQLGITAMVPMRQLQVGPHQLVLTSRADTVRRQVIPFWKTQ